MCWTVFVLQIAHFCELLRPGGTAAVQAAVAYGRSELAPHTPKVSTYQHADLCYQVMHPTDAGTVRTTVAFAHPACMGAVNRKADQQRHPDLKPHTHSSHAEVRFQTGILVYS